MVAGNAVSLGATIQISPAGLNWAELGAAQASHLTNIEAAVDPSRKNSVGEFALARPRAIQLENSSRSAVSNRIFRLLSSEMGNAFTPIALTPMPGMPGEGQSEPNITLSAISSMRGK